MDSATNPTPQPSTFLGWLSLFGPGAVIASLTIGTGELIFSSRGGAIFGYRILFLFVVISILKWILVIGTSRHFVLTGVHPYERMFDLPGPRGWAAYFLFLIAAVSIPIWVSFHCGVIGNLTSWITGTKGQFGGGIDFLWGVIFLAAVVLLCMKGGYSVLESVQLFIVGTMVMVAAITLILYKPDWIELLLGAILPSKLEYPDWLAASYPDIHAQPVWIETTRYVGVIGGAGFDYMAYTSFLRDKRWGRAGDTPASQVELQEMANDPQHPVRLWLRAPFFDLTISFLLVIAVSAVFVASGALILGPERQIPDEENLLNLQAQFVTQYSKWLLPLYVCGAFLTMIGTLYATVEVACSFAAEMMYSLDRKLAATHAKRIRQLTIAWCGVFAFAILAWLFAYRYQGAEGKPKLLLVLLTPAALITGVLSCGLFCLLNAWMERRFLPQQLRMPMWMGALNLLAAVVFVGLGIKGFWDYENRSLAVGSIATLLIGGSIAAIVIRRRMAHHDALDP